MSKNIFKISSLAFYLLAVLFFFVVGLYATKLSGAGKDQGLAAGAIVLMWGLIFALAALVGALLVVANSSQRAVIRLNWILLLLVLGLYGYSYYELNNRKKEAAEIQLPGKTTTPPPAPEN